MALFVTGCATTQPRNVNDVCDIFVEKDDWYEAANESAKRWGSPIPVMMAILHQESRFISQAQPERSTILGFIPGPRPSNAYGYPQALDSTWDNYVRSVGNYGADRDDFTDSIDFVGWYNNVSNKSCKIKSTDTYNLYLAYHEGQGGFNRRSYKNKAWLKKVANKVSTKANAYTKQLNGCEKRLQSSSWWPF